MFENCKSKFSAVFGKLKEVFLIFQSWQPKSRVRRCAQRIQTARFRPINGVTRPIDGVKISFLKRHIFSDEMFSRFDKKSLKRLEMDTLKDHRTNIDVDPPTKNTFIRQSDARKLRLKENSWEYGYETHNGKKTGKKTVSYRESEMDLDVLHVEDSNARNTINKSGVYRGKARVRFFMDEATGEIFHMDPVNFTRDKIAIKLAD